MSCGPNPGSTRPSRCTVALVGRTLILSPARTMFGVAVLRNSGISVRPVSPARSSGSASRGLRSSPMTRAAAPPVSASMASSIPLTTGVRWMGSRGRSSRASRPASRVGTPPPIASEPWPPGPRMVATSWQICFSDTCTGETGCRRCPA